MGYEDGTTTDDSSADASETLNFLRVTEDFLTEEEVNLDLELGPRLADQVQADLPQADWPAGIYEIQSDVGVVQPSGTGVQELSSFLEEAHEYIYDQVSGVVTFNVPPLKSEDIQVGGNVETYHSITIKALERWPGAEVIQGGLNWEELRTLDTRLPPVRPIRPDAPIPFEEDLNLDLELSDSYGL